jgi:hypothetical protein
MCQGCWKERGSPSLTNDKIKAAAELIAGVYEHHGCGGGLHIIVDDWNLEDSSLQFCEDYIEKPEYRASRNDEVTDERLEAERACLRALKAMTEEERASALALYDGYVQVS